MMGSQLTRQEESRKSVLETLDKPIPDSDLIALAGFPDDPKEAFSQGKWGSLGDCLWDVLREADTSVSPLTVTWEFMNLVMSTGVGDSRRKTRKGVSGKSSSLGTSRTLTPLPEPPWVKYPSPKDYEKPVYPSPRDFVKPTYPSPARLERMGAPEEAGAARSSPFAPLSLWVSLPSPAPKSGQPTGNQQSAGTTIPSAPPLACTDHVVLACPCRAAQPTGKCNACRAGGFGGSARRPGWQTQLAAGAGLCGAARPLSADGRARPAS